jgi:hypothetical protein
VQVVTFFLWEDAPDDTEPAFRQLSPPPLTILALKVGLGVDQTVRLRWKHPATGIWCKLDDYCLSSACDAARDTNGITLTAGAGGRVAWETANTPPGALRCFIAFGGLTNFG